MTKRQATLFPEMQPTKTYVADIPELAAEWHPTKNKALIPEDTLHGSNKKVWWQCSSGHEWQAAIHSRVSGRGCPYCSSKLPTSENNLAVLYPDLLTEWHYDKNKTAPEEYLSQSNKTVWWKCIKGHEWQAPVYRRTNAGAGCPQCTNQTSRNELRIYTELASAFDRVHHRHKVNGVELDVYLPEHNLAIEYDGKYWHRDKANKDQEKQQKLEALGINLLRVREAPLRQLGNHDIIIKEGSLLTKKAMNQIVAFIDPDSSYLKLKGFTAEDTYLKYIDYFPSPFPEKSLAKVMPELAAQWHPTKNAPLTPENFTSGAKPKVWWQCDKGHEWKAAIYSRSTGVGCPYCSGKYVNADNCMANTNPEMAAMFHPTRNAPLTPSDVVAGTGKRLWWQCQCGHEWQQSGDHYKRGKIQQPCSKCRER